MRVSLCMIVKDEEEVLERCLASARPLADEIVIADTGSSDRTPEIAKRYADVFFFEPWRENFARARNAALARATGEYLLWLDADDVVTEENIPRFFALMSQIAAQNADVAMCPYVSGGLTYFRERILRRDGRARFRGRVHECVPPFGKVIRGEFTVTHMGSGKARGARNLEIYRKWASEEKLTGRDLFYYGRELYDNRLYTESAAVLRDMLEGEGWYVNKIEACRILSACYAARGEAEKALSALFQSFCYGTPRASVLCEIAGLFSAKKRYRDAAFWYEAALAAEDHAAEGDFELPACHTIIPALGLVVAYEALGDRASALKYHRMSAAFAPEHPSVKYNARYFKEA